MYCATDAYTRLYLFSLYLLNFAQGTLKTTYKPYAVLNYCKGLYRVMLQLYFLRGVKLFKAVLLTSLLERF